MLGNIFRDHLQNLGKVFERFRQYQLKLKPKKWILFQTSVDFLGRTVGPDGYVGDGYLETMENWPRPTATHGVQRFCGFANYHRNFIPKFAQIAAPLYQVSGKKLFVWGDEQERAFNLLRNSLKTAPVLTLPNADGEFILDTDASNVAVAAELLQVQDGQERVISYARTNQVLYYQKGTAGCDHIH